ncbi:MAG: DUF559 domain-containing protein [Nocardioidaceae bacterium]
MSSPFDPSNPFTTAQALAAGLSRATLRGPRFRQLRHGVYVSAEQPASVRLDARAALAVHPPDAFASHVTAARVYDLPVPVIAEEHVSVFCANDRRRGRGLRSHLAARSTRVLVVHDIRVSSPADMFVELASLLGLVDLVIVGDAMVRKEWYSPERLVAFCAASTDPHAGRALEAARLVREGVDSPMETRLRLLLVLAGLPEPKVNLKIRDALGHVRRRFDLSYPEVKVIVEYDGRQHAEDVAQYDADIYRREELDREGWRIVVVTSKGVYQRPEETLRRVLDTLRERDMPGLPRRLSDRWRAHFPTR